MSVLWGIIQIVFAVMLVVGAIPVTLLMAAFACDGGMPDRRLLALLIIAFSVVPCSLAVWLGRRGWYMIWA